MSKMKNLCDWDRLEIERNASELIAVVQSPKYICRKCARVSKDTGMLCKPIKMKKLIKN